MAAVTFNAETVEPSSFGPVPAGDYRVQIIKSDMVETKLDFPPFRRRDRESQ
jgi:hypothetical protein